MTTLRFLAPFSLAVAVCTLASGVAHADSTTSAQVLFEEGRKLMAANQYAEACPKFAESQKLDPGAGTLLNLALCYEKNDQLASAWVTYTDAAADADRSGRPEWVKRGKEKAGALAPILSTLAVGVPKNARVEGLEVTRDGQPLSSAEWGIKVPIDGGEHTIEAHALGHEAWTLKVTAPIKNGALVVTVPLLPKAVVLAKPPAVVRQDDTKHASAGGAQRTVGIVLGAVGVIGLGLGGAFGANAMAKHSGAKKDCNRDETRCGTQGLDAYQSANTSADIATIAFIAGGALLVGGVVLYLTAPRGKATTSALWQHVNHVSEGFAF